MNRFLLLVVIAVGVFLIVVFANRPELVQDIWIWLVGLSGSIVKTFQLVVDYLKNKFTDTDEDDDEDDDEENHETSNTQEITSNEETQPKDTKMSQDKFNGVTLKVLRFSDDGQTTIGLFYINNKFYCYTLEDTFRKDKIAGETRIPSGVYKVNFMEYDTPLTLKYRTKYPDWFTYHLHIQDVPNFKGIYIHSGGNHKHTEGCLLVSDSLNVSNDATYFSNSRKTYKELYKFVSEQLTKKVPVRILIQDENWINGLNK